MEFAVYAYLMVGTVCFFMTCGHAVREHTNELLDAIILVLLCAIASALWLPVSLCAICNTVQSTVTLFAEKGLTSDKSGT